MEERPAQHFGVVAIEKGTFVSPSTKVANFTYLYRIKISGKEDKSNTYGGFSGNISFFIRGRTTKPVVSIWFIDFSTYFYFYHLVRFTKIYHFFICVCVCVCIYMNIYIYVYIYIYIFIYIHIHVYIRVCVCVCVCIAKFHKILCVSFFRADSGLCIFWHGRSVTSCTIPNGSPFLPSRT